MTVLAPDEIVQGVTAWQIRQALMAAGTPNRPIAVFPDISVVASVLGDIDRSGQPRRPGAPLRAITLASAHADPVRSRHVALVAKSGIEIRTLTTLPGWFYVDAGVVAAIPLTWGEKTPTNARIVRDPAVLAPLAGYIESLWASANLLITDPEQDPVLGLLSQGLSDGAIASALGVSLRTVRRRIAAAAEIYGAASRFALGAAWERARAAARATQPTSG